MAAATSTTVICWVGSCAAIVSGDDQMPRGRSAVRPAPSPTGATAAAAGDLPASRAGAIVGEAGGMPSAGSVGSRSSASCAEEQFTQRPSGACISQDALCSGERSGSGLLGETPPSRCGWPDLARLLETNLEASPRCHALTAPRRNTRVAALLACLERHPRDTSMPGSASTKEHPNW